MDGGGESQLSDAFIDAFRAYGASRHRFYSQPSRVLNRLLQKDVLLYAVRGVQTADDFVEQAFAAHESSSEETAWGNAWQAALAAALPNAVGGGDLLLERDGILWVIEVKMGAQNRNSRAQDLRKLKTRRDAEAAIHHPGRKGVMPMYAFVRGKGKEIVDHYKSNDRANADLTGFTYHHLVGRPFLRWLGLEFDPTPLLEHMREESAELHQARQACLSETKKLLLSRLQSGGHASSIEDVLAFVAEREAAGRNSSPQDQSSS